MKLTEKITKIEDEKDLKRKHMIEPPITQLTSREDSRPDEREFRNSTEQGS